MLIENLKDILTSKVKLMYKLFGDYEYELDEAVSIDELINQGYGKNKIYRIFVFRCVLHIVIE